jgi:hypothetical protein
VASQDNCLVLAESICNIDTLLWVESRTAELLIQAVRFVKAVGPSEPEHSVSYDGE